MSRSFLNQKFEWKIRSHGKISKRVYATTIILTPKVTNQDDVLNLLVRLDTDLDIVDPKLAVFKEATSLRCEYMALHLHDSLFSTSTNLTATILNSGEVIYEKRGRMHMHTLLTFREEAMQFFRLNARDYCSFTLYQE